jgi:hypothetical protein
MAAVVLASLAVAVLLALLFSPQRPGPAADADVLARWTSDARERFGRWYDTLSVLGVLYVGRAVWLRVLLAWGALTLAVGLADGVGQVVGAWRRPDLRYMASFFDDSVAGEEWQMAQERETAVETLARRLAWPAWIPWMQLRIHPRRLDVGEASYLYQDWRTWRRMASSLVHLGLMFVLVGVALEARLGWREEGLMLMPGQAVELGRQPDVTLRLETVEGPGAVGQATSRIALDGLDRTSRKGSVAVGRPYTVHGLTVYQRHVGPILRVSAWDADGSAPGSGAGSPIPLVDASTEMEPADEVRLAFTESRTEQYLLMPDIRKVVRLVLYRQGEVWDAHGDELQIEVYSGDLETPEARDSIVGDESVELKGIVYEFIREQYAVLDVIRSSYQPLIRVGMGLTLLGLMAALFIPSIRLWVRVVEEKGTSVVALGGEMPGQSKALAGWRLRLGGHDASG